MKYQRFEDLPVWQEAVRLLNAVLDLTEPAHHRMSGGFRNQLERAALSVSNNIAEGFERTTTTELLHFLAIARGSAGEVRSMMLAVKERVACQPHRRDLAGIRSLAESCSRQIMAWSLSVEAGKVQGKRHMSPELKAQREASERWAAFRRRFYLNMSPSHPLYNTSEAREIRGREREQVRE